MVETVGASALLNSSASEQPEPSRADAFARRVELGHSEEFRARLEKGEPAAVEEVRRLNSGITKFDVANIGEAAEAREMLDREQRVERWRAHADIPDAIAEQIRQNTPVSRAEYRMAEQEKKRMLADADFRKEYFSGNRAARLRMALVSIILGSKIAEGR